MSAVISRNGKAEQSVLLLGYMPDSSHSVWQYALRSIYSTGHALPLVGTRFSCCARRRAQVRGCVAIRDEGVATGNSLIANRICEPNR